VHDVPRAGEDRERAGLEITGQRGGIHNSVTRAVLKPTHMIGGYAQQSYGFNYYGTVGTNRDEFVIVRKMAKVDWLDKPTADQPRPPARPRRPQNEDPRANRDGAEPRQVHRLPHLLGHLQERVDQPRRHGIRLVQQRRDQARHRLSQGLGEPEALEGRLGPQANGKIEPRIGAKWRVLAKIFANPDLPEIDDYYEPFTFDYEHLQKAPELRGLPDRAPALADHRRAHGEDRVGPELGGDPRRRVRQALRTTTSRASRRRSTASSKTPS
jgi:hypothetical protein